MLHFLLKLRYKIKKDGFKIMVKYITILMFASLIYGSYLYFYESLPLTDIWYYLITTATTVGYGDISPKTNIGKIMCSVYMLTSITTLSIILGLVAEKFVNKIEKVKKGEIKMGNKIVDLIIVGYPSGDKVKEIVVQLRKNKDFFSKKIVCITNELNEKPLWFSEYGVEFKKGLGSVREVLVESGVLNCVTALVLAQNSDDIKSDDYTSSTVSAIEKLSKSTRTIVEKVREDNLLFEASNADVITRVTSPQVLAQEVLSRGALQLQNEMFNNGTKTSQMNFLLDEETTWGELAIKLIKENKILEGFCVGETEKFDLIPEFEKIIPINSIIKYRGIVSNK